MKLFYVPKTRASRPRWVLEELGVPYELVRLDPSKGETKTPEHTARHPLQHVPVLETERGALFESAAICLHLADLHPEKGLAPAPGTHERGLLYQWLFYGMSELEPKVSAVAKERAAKTAPDAPAMKDAQAAAAKVLAPLEKALAGREYLVGGAFSVADVVLGAVAFWASRLGAVTDSPNVSAWLARLTARPAYKKATAD